jgi:hypothetical protein
MCEVIKSGGVRYHGTAEPGVGLLTDANVQIALMSKLIRYSIPLGPLILIFKNMNS